VPIILAFGTVDRFLFIFANADAFIVNAKTIPQDVVGCGNVSNLEESKGLLLLLGSINGWLDPLNRDQ